MLDKKYIIITSAYNEEQHIEQTIKSVIKQTILPAEWIIVNDGSTDKTESIIKKYANKYEFIKLLNKKNDYLEFGSHVAVNFNIGLNNLSVKDWEYIAQLDADISIDRSDFYEFQINEFKKNKNLGSTSGITYTIKNGVKKLNTKRPYWRTGGATKFYRRKCFEDIEGIEPIFAWDGLDVYKAMFHDWKTRTLYELEVHHLGVSRINERHQTKEKVKLIGKSLYQRGYPIEFVLFKSISFLKKSFTHQRAFLKGYYSAKKNKEKQYITIDEKKFIRKVQYLRIFDRLTHKETL
ncbi:glycosyltransferase family 2 protein [bacterium]|nr:glycosyltransferase family 2 protein [bacterium]